MCCTPVRTLCTIHIQYTDPLLYLVSTFHPILFALFIYVQSATTASNDGSKSEKPVLRYFQSRARAEVIRLALELAGIEYEQKLHSGEDWPEIKTEGLEKGWFLFGQVPALHIDGKHLVQSGAIIKYIGLKNGLLPSDVDSLVIADVLLGGIEDLRKRYSQLVYSPNFESEKGTFVNDVLPMWLKHFEKILASKDDDFFFGSKLTVVDLAFFDVLTAVLPLNPSVLHDNKLHSIETFVAGVLTNKKIKKYLASDRRPKFQNGNYAHFDNEKNPSGFDINSRPKYSVHLEL